MVWLPRQHLALFTWPYGKTIEFHNDLMRSRMIYSKKEEKEIAL